MPSSLEGYYQVRPCRTGAGYLLSRASSLTDNWNAPLIVSQETGRAGRDGKNSVCILYYAISDTRLLRRFIDESEGTYEQKKSRHANLGRVIEFCVNRFDCRRTQVLRYFGEHFQPEDCRGTCDNCRNTAGMAKKEVDMTDRVKTIVQIVQEIHDQNVTLPQLNEIYYGSNTKFVSQENHRAAISGVDVV